MARNLLLSGKSFSVQLCRELDTCWKLAEQFSGEGRQLAMQEGELIEIGRHTPASRRAVEAAIEDGLPDHLGRRTFYKLYWEEERAMATTLACFSQLKAVIVKETEMFTLRANDVVRTLRKLREEGSRVQGLEHMSLDELAESKPLIAWRHAG